MVNEQHPLSAKDAGMLAEHAQTERLENGLGDKLVDGSVEEVLDQVN